MPNVTDLISPSFSTEKSSTYRLSIREYPNGFSFCAVDSDDNSCVAIKLTPSLSHEEPLLALHFSEVRFVKDAAFSVVPSAFLRGGDSDAEFLPIGRHLKKRAVLHSALLPNGNAILFDTKKFPGLQMDYIPRHPLQELYQFGTSLQRSDYCMAEMNGAQLNIITVTGHKLRLANTFAYETSEDAAYYILSVFQQLALDAETVPLHLIADERAPQCPTGFLSEYIRNVNIVKPGEGWDAVFPADIYHRFATQLYSLICA